MNIIEHQQIASQALNQDILTPQGLHNALATQCQQQNDAILKQRIEETCNPRPVTQFRVVYKSLWSQPKVQIITAHDFKFESGKVIFYMYDQRVNAGYYPHRFVAFIPEKDVDHITHV